MAREEIKQVVRIPINSDTLEGVLRIPKFAHAIVLFAYGTTGSRHSARNNYISGILKEAGVATFLFELLTEGEDKINENSLNVDLLAERLTTVIKWLQKSPETKHLKLGLFATNTRAAAAIKTAARLGPLVKAIVSRSGNLDLAADSLEQIRSPTLLIVGESDTEFLTINRQAYGKIPSTKKLGIVAGATHYFDETAPFEYSAKLACDWFRKYLFKKRERDGQI